MTQVCRDFLISEVHSDKKVNIVKALGFFIGLTNSRAATCDIDVGVKRHFNFTELNLKPFYFNMAA
jgi:hypothetical protein